MTILSFAAPIESALPAAQGMLTAAATILRPALAIGAGITLFMLFRPLFVGFWRTVLIVVKPRKTLEQRITRHRFKSAIVLNRMANETSRSQPNLASELRCFASRD